MHKYMKKIIVIGCPGSGKSTFATELHRITGIPLFHLDLMYWNADRTTVDRAVFLDRLAEVMAQDEWIIDGNYNSTMEMRMQACDTVVFLDYPVEVCVSGILERRGRERPDLPWIEPDEIDGEFLAFVKDYNEQSRPKVLELMSTYSNKRIFTFANRNEADEFLEQLKG